MIDRLITGLQALSVNTTSNYFVAHRDEAKIIVSPLVMPLTVAFTGVLDYFKLPLAAIEELAKGILTVPFALTNKSWAQYSFKHLHNSGSYAAAFIDKIFLGSFDDLRCMDYAFKHPLNMPFFSPPSFFGSHVPFYGVRECDEANNPSLYHMSRLKEST